MRLLRAVLDTNVLVAAAIAPRGLCARLLEAALDGRWQLVASPQLAREKFRRWFTEDDANRFVAAISAVADVVPDPPTSSQRSTSDPKDEYLVALARVADVAALVSGDTQLTDLANLDPPVLTPATFFDRLPT